MNNDEAIRRMRRCILSLLSTQPFFGSLAFRMRLVEDHSCNNIAANGVEIRYNPKWVTQDANADEITLAIAHIVMACGLKHHLRRNERDYHRWQEASHLVTRPFLHNAGLTKETGGLDMSVEKAYQTLPDPPSSTLPPPTPPLPAGGRQPTPASGASQPDQNQSGLDPQPTTGASQTSDPSPIPSPQPGEVQDAPDPAPGSGDQTLPSDQFARTREQSTREASQEWDEAMHQAVTFAKGQGHIPQDIQEMVSSIHRTTTDWRTLLHRFMTDSARNDYTWSRPNRRFIDAGLYLPSLHSQGMPPIIFAIDTSGSMDSAALNLIWTEVRQAVNDVDPELVTIIQCDTVVHSIQDYRPDELPERLQIKGRGGTAYIPVFQEVDLRTPPACLIYLTDLECETKPTPPHYPVLWAATGNPPEHLTPDFGERVDISEE